MVPHRLGEPADGLPLLGGERALLGLGVEQLPPVRLGDRRRSHQSSLQGTRPVALLAHELHVADMAVVHLGDGQPRIVFGKLVAEPSERHELLAVAPHHAVFVDPYLAVLERKVADAFHRSACFYEVVALHLARERESEAVRRGSRRELHLLVRPRAGQRDRERSARALFENDCALNLVQLHRVEHAVPVAWLREDDLHRLVFHSHFGDRLRLETAFRRIQLEVQSRQSLLRTAERYGNGLEPVGRHALQRRGAGRDGLAVHVHEIRPRLREAEVAGAVHRSRLRGDGECAGVRRGVRRIKVQLPCVPERIDAEHSRLRERLRIAETPRRRRPDAPLRALAGNPRAPYGEQPDEIPLGAALLARIRDALVERPDGNGDFRRPPPLRNRCPCRSAALPLRVANVDVVARVVVHAEVVCDIASRAHDYLVERVARRARREVYLDALLACDHHVVVIAALERREPRRVLRLLAVDGDIQPVAVVERLEASLPSCRGALALLNLHEARLPWHVGRERAGRVAAESGDAGNREGRVTRPA